MNIKRALFGITALMLLPAVAFSAVINPITPAPNTANIAVSVLFSDGNDETSVNLTLVCNTGTYNPAPVNVTAPFGASPQYVFVVADIPNGFVNPCTVTQSAVSGYATDAYCDDQPGSDTKPAVNCENPATEAARLSVCQYGDVNNEEVGLCTLDNVVNPVDVKITKTWDVTNVGGGTEVDTSATIRLTCDAEIVGVEEDEGHWVKTFNTVGNKTVTAKVIPEWEGSGCSAVETSVDSSVEVTSTCGSMTVSAGSGDSCEITNTVFFEGIPTLNQYGLAIMALLMLGVGFVGFRRFV